MEHEETWPSGYDGHRIDQIRRLARESTPTQRLQWLSETLRILYRNGLIPNKLKEIECPREEP